MSLAATTSGAGLTEFPAPTVKLYETRPPNNPIRRRDPSGSSPVGSPSLASSIMLVRPVSTSTVPIGSRLPLISNVPAACSPESFGSDAERGLSFFRHIQFRP